jgi:DNA-binding MarR family transcriptional regulator
VWEGWIVISHVEKVEAVNKRREYLKNTKPFSISPIVNDILFSIYYCNLKGTPVNITSLITYCRGSDRTIRTHLKTLIDCGWVDGVPHQIDKREVRLSLTDKGVDLIKIYIDLF